VARLGSAFILGMQGEGVAACGKHFPGHGDTDVDSHLGLPMLHHTRRRFDLCELLPFRAAIDAGVASMMTAHLMIPNIDAVSPASISRTITRDILREELRFDGVIFTDDLKMEGSASIYPPHEATWRAIAAGADVAMICRGLDEGRMAVERLSRAVDEGSIGEEEVSQSLKRVADFKARFCQPSAKRPPMKVIGCREHRKLVAEISKSASIGRH